MLDIHPNIRSIPSGVYLWELGELSQYIVWEFNRSHMVQRSWKNPCICHFFQWKWWQICGHHKKHGCLQPVWGGGWPWTGWALQYLVNNVAQVESKYTAIICLWLTELIFSTKWLVNFCECCRGWLELVLTLTKMQTVRNYLLFWINKSLQYYSFPSNPHYKFRCWFIQPPFLAAVFFLRKGKGAWPSTILISQGGSHCCKFQS